MSYKSTEKLDDLNNKVFAITSGKGGVGKTFFSSNLAYALAKRGKRVLIIDADLGLANIDIALNLHHKITIHDVFDKKSSIKEAVIQHSEGFDVLLAGSGMAEYSRLTSNLRKEFLILIKSLMPQYEVVLLDTGAGISDVVLFAISLASKIFLLATPEPTSLTDAYATIKVLATQQQRKQIYTVINQITREGDGRIITSQLQQVVNRFVRTNDGDSVKLLCVGEIPSDRYVRDSIMRRQLMLQKQPNCPASMAITELACKLEAKYLN